MSSFIHFIVQGEPVGQPRPRATIRKRKSGKVHASVFDDGKADGWKQLVAIAAQRYVPRSPITCPVRVDIVFIFPRTQEGERKGPAEAFPHDQKPDRDNLDKAVLDTLTRLGFWKDDKQVYDGRITKLYAAKDRRPGAEITITPDQ